MAELFTNNMQRITQALLSFLERYQAPGAKPQGFAKEWQGIVETLSSRIVAEEQQLFRLYEKTVGKPRRTRAR
jgi:hypothetical protein